MKCTVTPESVLALLDQVGKGLSKRKRESSQITFSATRNPTKREAEKTFSVQSLFRNYESINSSLAYNWN